jgi:hypothetical protein
VSMGVFILPMLSNPAFPPLEGEGSDAWPERAIAELGGVKGRLVALVAPPHPQSLPPKGREALERMLPQWNEVAA